MSRKFKISWFIIAFLFGLLVNELNLYFVRKENPGNIPLNEKSTMHGYTIYNVDHEWYLPQIKHMMAGHGYTLEPHNPEMKVRRTPLYPLWYGLHYVLFGEEKSFFVIRYSQLLLFSLAAILLGMAVFNFSLDERWAKWATALFSLSPFIFIYAYHTITEGLTPFLVVLPFYFFSRFHVSGNRKFLLLAGIATGLAMLNRPLTGLLLPAFLLSLLRKDLFRGPVFKELALQSLFLALPAILTLAPWTVRNYFATRGEIVLLEKIYYEDPMDFGRGHFYFRNWISGWANPATVSAEQFSNALRDNIRLGRTDNDSIIDQFITTLPAYSGEKNRVRSALNSLNDCFAEKERLRLADPHITRKQLAGLECEEKAKRQWEELISDFKRESPLRYHLLTPLLMIKEGIFQSNSLFYGSLNPAGRDFSLPQKLIKGCMYLLNLMLFISAFAFIFSPATGNNLKIMILSFLFLTLFSLTYVFFRYLDARYLLPLYPFLYISMSYFIALFLRRLKRE
ncbi:MAG: glycosyltransferase family 39 protein [Bacteroidota bacterium]